MKNKNNKVVYASFDIKKVPFTMLKEDDNDVFLYNNNKIVITDNEIFVNNESFTNVNDVVKIIKEM